MLSLSYGRIIVKAEEKLVGLVPESFETYQLAMPGDIIIRCTDLQNDQTSLRTGLVKDRGIITSAYLCLGVREGFQYRYVHYLLHLLDISKAIYKLGSGLRQNLSFDDFKRLPVLKPSYEEQLLISDYLDQKSAQIDQAIQIKERQIELLKERKQILIQQAVTRGLDPHAPMRDSGIEWIGEIPAHWEALPSRYLFRVVRRNERDGTEPKLSVTQSSGIVLTSEMQENSTQAESFDTFQVCHEDDLVLNKYKAHLGVFWRAPLRGVITNNYTVFRALPRADSKYYEILFHTPVYQSIFRSLVYGVTEGMMPLYTNDFYSMLAIAPPKIEQIEIVAYINKKGQELDVAIKNILGQIEKLKEYKATLINSAVTGKIKVPGVVEPTEIEEREIA